MKTGTEHEYSLSDPTFRPLPVSDEILAEVAGSPASEAPFGEVTLCKELQKNVLEFIPDHPSESLLDLENQVYSGIRRFYRRFGERYILLGLGMHPTLRLEETCVWNHDEGEYYELYDRLFSLRQHGWLNIQALQVNLEYRSDEELVDTYNRIRSLLPYLIAVSASSPFVEGKATGPVDNRLLYYRKNQEAIPVICNGIVPESLSSAADYQDLLDEMYRELRKRDAELLCEEWVNSAGIIVRSGRRCIEVKALDGQECVRSDMAITAFLRALLRNRDLSLETDRDALLALTEAAIGKGTRAFPEELAGLLACARKTANREEREFLPIVEDRIRNGSLAEQMQDRFKRTRDMAGLLSALARALRTNTPFPDPKPL